MWETLLIPLSDTEPIPLCETLLIPLSASAPNPLFGALLTPLVDTQMTAAEVLVVLGMAVAVFVPKALPLVIVSEGHTARLRPWLQYVAPAVLGALVAPAIVAPSGRPGAPGWDQLAYLLAFLVAIVTRRMVPSLVAGLAAIVLVTVLRS